jgi:hypothetical protein
MIIVSASNRIDWLMSAGFDFFASENGTSEFTHPAPKRMLAWKDEVVRHLDAHHDGKRAYMKVHVSSLQRTDQYADPVDGGPLNINFLPYYADRRLAVMPHTVAYYGLTDPAPTYGNIGFDNIAAYMKLESGRREVIWYPETAYWCSFDIDVPLFLSIYAERRLRNLRLIADWERKTGAARPKRIDGQVFFSSGWEWGYWLGDVVAARASWNPLLDEPDHDAAFKALLTDLFRNFGNIDTRLAELILETVQLQRRDLYG